MYNSRQKNGGRCIKKYILLLLVSTILIGFFYPFRLNRNPNIYLKTSQEKINLPIQYYNLTGNTIFIDDTDPEYNWNYTKYQYEWCSGNGTKQDPYTIENIFIRSERNEWHAEITFLKIINSNKFFIIRNCLIFIHDSNYTYYSRTCGIRLNNVSNGILDNNTIYGHYIGFDLYDVSNIELVNNHVSNNTMYGIHVFNHYNVTIKDNFFINKNPNSQRYGINTYYSGVENNNLKIINNTFVVNPNLIVKSSAPYLIQKNTFIQSSLHIEADNCTIINNTFKGNEIWLSGNSNYFFNNTMYNADVGVYGNRTYNIIKNNLMHGGCINVKKNGLYYESYRTYTEIVGNSFYNKDYFYAIDVNDINCLIIKNNLIFNTPNEGIRILNCGSHNISNNFIEGCYEGISLWDGWYNRIWNNTIKSNEIGIHFELSKRNYIYNNSIVENYKEGILLEATSSSLIHNNTIIGNQNSGLELISSSFNNITSNYLRYNSIGIRLEKSNYSRTSNNFLANNSVCIIQINCRSNVFENNSCDPITINDKPPRLPVLYSILITIFSALSIFAIVFLLIWKYIFTKD